MYFVVVPYCLLLFLVKVLVDCISFSWSVCCSSLCWSRAFPTLLLDEIENSVCISFSFAMCSSRKSSPIFRISFTAVCQLCMGCRISFCLERHFKVVASRTYFRVYISSLFLRLSDFLSWSTFVKRPCILSSSLFYSFQSDVCD